MSQNVQSETGFNDAGDRQKVSHSVQGGTVSPKPELELAALSRMLSTHRRAVDNRGRMVR